MMDDLSAHLRRFRRWLRLRGGWVLGQKTLWLPAACYLLIQAAGRIRPIERLDTWSVAPFIIWLIALLLWSGLRPLPAMSVALRVDLELDLRERLSSALAFKDKPAIHTGYANFIKAQHKDALAKAAAIQPTKAMPLRWIRRPLVIASILILAALASALLPNPMDSLIAQRQAIRQEAARQAERVEQIRQEVERAQELSPEDRQELVRQLERLADKLRANRGDLEQSMADISNLEKQLTERLDVNRMAQGANLEALAVRLEAMTGAKPRSDQSSAEAATQALGELASQLPEMSSEEREQVAQELAQMAAQSAQSGDAELAQALAEMAQAAQEGEIEQAQQASQSAQQALSQAQSRLAGQQAIQQAINQLQASRQALAQTASQAAGQAALAQGQTPGQTAAQNQGQNPGKSAGQPGGSQGQPGSNVSGGGTRANTLPPASGGRGNVRPQGQAPNVAAGELRDQVYAPWERPASSQGELNIPGQETGQGETQTRQGQSNLPGSSNQALVPYQQVFNSYLSAANQALQQSYIPAGMSDYIRLYFSQLNP